MLLPTVTTDVNGNSYKGPATINGGNGFVAVDVVNCHGNTSVNVFDSFSATVNIDGKWSGNFSGTPGGAAATMTINGGTWVHNSATYWGYNGDTAVINTAVTGTGSFGLANFEGNVDRLEFLQSVSAGQTINLSGVANAPRGGGTQNVIIAKPTEFLGTIVEASPYAAIDLEHLAGADSYTFKNDMLSIYAGGKVIDSLHLVADAANSAFSIEKTASGGVELYGSWASAKAIEAGVALPIHV